MSLCFLWTMRNKGILTKASLSHRDRTGNTENIIGNWCNWPNNHLFQKSQTEWRIHSRAACLKSMDLVKQDGCLFCWSYFTQKCQTISESVKVCVKRRILCELFLNSKESKGKIIQSYFFFFYIRGIYKEMEVHLKRRKLSVKTLW